MQNTGLIWPQKHEQHAAHGAALKVCQRYITVSTWTTMQSIIAAGKPRLQASQHSFTQHRCFARCIATLASKL
jgi:hypothetical protein